MHLCISWLSYNTTFLSKATQYFSHMLQRQEAKSCQQESLPHLGIKPTTSRVKYAPIEQPGRLLTMYLDVNKMKYHFGKLQLGHTHLN